MVDEVDISALSITEPEEGEWHIAKGGLDLKESYKLCLVIRVFTEAVVKFEPMKNTPTDIWQPLGGVNIMDLGVRRILFRFLDEVDIKRVINGHPWTFNNHLLVTQTT